jgi:hypothetical protein
MINISEFIIENEQTILKHKGLELLYQNDILSADEVTLLSNNIFQWYTTYPLETRMNLYNYTNHVLCTNERIGMLSIQCTISNTYIQFQRTVPSITFDNTIIYYIDNELYLTENRIVIATGSINKQHIVWSDTITFDNNCYIKLPFTTNLPDDNQIIPTIILNKLSNEVS